MCMNVAAAGPLVCVWLEAGEGRGDKLAGRAGRYLAWSAVVLFLAGMLLGVLMGWLLWSDAYLGALKQVRSRAEFGAWEILFSLVLMIVHAVWWRIRCAAQRFERIARAILPIASGTNLMYHFPPLFVILSQLSAGQAVADAELTSAEFLGLMLGNEVLARSTHFLLAAAAMCGVMLIGYALRLRRRGEPAENVQRVAEWGGRLALAPTLLQLGVGVWVLLALPPRALAGLMGADWLAAGLFVLSLLGALALMHHLAAVAFGDVRRSSLIRAMVTMVVVVLLMSGVLERTRVLRRSESAAGVSHSARFYAAE
jgi:hypothetical protein